MALLIIKVGKPISTITSKARIPISTYRLQLNHLFPLHDAAKLTGYLKKLGISDWYTSPLLKAQPGSMHGYDIVDHNQFNPEICNQKSFVSLARKLRQLQMGLIIDVVPNHMSITGSQNQWWNDVLENGPSSPYADFFDIDWSPPKIELANKVLLPMLGDQYGRVLENQQIKITFQDGMFFALYYEAKLPLAPRTYTQILEIALPALRSRFDEANPNVMELESLIHALEHLPPRTETDEEQIRIRLREKEIIRRRLSELVTASEEVRVSIDFALEELNGKLGDPTSFDALESLISSQAYRLSNWRVASDEINYRRFFDINELAAIRIEEPKVFSAVHRLMFEMCRKGYITGLRIDHVDGLRDPAKYFHDLQREAKPTSLSPPCYTVVEKILSSEERLRSGWAVDGTTGYDFLNLVNGVFVETGAAPAFNRLYRRIKSDPTNFENEAYECKQLILRVSLSSELNVLARHLERISEQHRWSRDFTFNSLQVALREVIACFPVYRSYTRREDKAINEEDSQHISRAIRRAKRKNPAINRSIFDFIGDLLMLRDPGGITTEQRDKRRDFVLRFQQLTSPTTAKGVEDTAFYRYYPLASLNEVGGNPDIFGVSIDTFHRKNHDRQQSWPHSLSATTTHDTKRSEDVRARINVLSEIPSRWFRSVQRWMRTNDNHKTIFDGNSAPDLNEEYLLYQTLVGVWPFELLFDAGLEANEKQNLFAEFTDRIVNYMLKALKEAKLHTSWINPDEEYEEAARNFINRVLAPAEENIFRTEFTTFLVPVAICGMLNSLSQVLLKITCPGVPDFYQGTEIWNLTLVDPDNRGHVDYVKRKKFLASLGLNHPPTPNTVRRLVGKMHDGRIKLYVTVRSLTLRKRMHELFSNGPYIPLSAQGARERNVIAFARINSQQNAQQAVIVITGRLFTSLKIQENTLSLITQGIAEGVWDGIWDDTYISLGDTVPTGGYYVDQFSGLRINPELREGAAVLPLKKLFTYLPMALLERISDEHD